MIRQNFKQAFAMLKENPFFSVISIMGTSVAITMIMVMVVIYQIQNGNYEPEVSRDRMLFVKDIKAAKAEGGFSASNISPVIAKTCFLTLETPEAVSLVQNRSQTLVTTVDISRRMKCDQLATDAAFWHIFRFHYLAGKPFIQSDIESGIRQVVISEQVARQMFGMADVSILGQTLLIGRKPYTICGIVKDVSPLADNAYSQIWIPYPVAEWNDVIIDEATYRGLTGRSRIYILARSTSDFPVIRKEVEKKIDQFNSNLTNITVDLLGQPDTQFTKLFRVWSNEQPDMFLKIMQYILILLIILMVPAMNLSGLTSSRMQKRMGELGVRKAFGATNGVLMNQILTENLFLTFIGGVIGLLLSFLTVVFLKNWLLGSWELSSVNNGFTLNAFMLFKPLIFIAALFFCIVLNLLSAGIPAWVASRKEIVYSLTDK